MLDKSIFAKEYIEENRKKLKCDPTLLERAIFAFGLLEAMVRSGCKFIFKGGTSLMLLLDKPLRLSTDIDIIVEPGTDILKYVKEASKIYPFIRFEEQKRKGINKITKQHFRFYYESLRDKTKEIPILLDVLYEKNHYDKLIKKEIKNSILKTVDKPIYVTMPNVNSLLGDKLTAFAPKTIGVKPLSNKEDGYVVDKRVETIKQFFDITSLFDSMTNLNEVKSSYEKTAKSELGYRGLKLEINDCLMDTFKASACIMSRGNIDKKDFELYSHGIKSISAFIINSKWNGETSCIQAAKIMYLTACLIKNIPLIKKIPQQEPIKGLYSKLNFIRKYNVDFFNMAAYSVRILKLE